MNRREALRILGLGEDATAADIKTAYKETAQILHPDRFSGNKKLQDRATEQFKNLQDAYRFLTEEDDLSSRSARSSARSSSAAADGKPRYTVRSKAADAAARIAGITAARVQLVAQRDVAVDERRNGVIMAAGGAVVALVCSRRAYGIIGIIAAIATALAVWGVVQIASAQRTIATIDEHLEELEAERKRLEKIIQESS